MLDLWVVARDSEIQLKEYQVEGKHEWRTREISSTASKVVTFQYSSRQHNQKGLPKGISERNNLPSTRIMPHLARPERDRRRAALNFWKPLVGLCLFKLHLDSKYYLDLRLCLWLSLLLFPIVRQQISKVLERSVIFTYKIDLKLKTSATVVNFGHAYATYCSMFRYCV